MLTTPWPNVLHGIGVTTAFGHRKFPVPTHISKEKGNAVQRARIATLLTNRLSITLMIYLTHMSNSTHCCNIRTATFHLLMSKLRLGRVCTFATATGRWRFCLDPSAGSWWSCYPLIWTALATHSLHHRMPLGGKRPMEMHSPLVVCAQGLRDMAVVWKRVCCSGANQRVTIGVPLSLTPNYSGSFCELVIAQSSVAQIMGGTFNPAPAPLPLPL